MTDREAMQQALDALEEINKLSIGENAICLPAEIDGAMDALRGRLAQPEQEPVAYWHKEFLKHNTTSDQPEQEPVAWRWKERINGDFDSWVISASEPPPYAIKQQPLYTITPQRQWQGLARLELQKAVEGLEDLEDCWIAIESALREKNT